MGNIIPCPMCGALGEVETVCQFCGMLIQPTETNTQLNYSRLLARPTVSHEIIAQKLSKYHFLSPFMNPGVAIVRIGSLYGLINRNADIIIPLSYSSIDIINDRWALLIEGDEYKLVDLVKWVPINWKEKVGFKQYSVAEGFQKQLIITRGYYRTRIKRERLDGMEWITTPTQEDVFMPTFCIYDTYLNKTVIDDEGDVIQTNRGDFYLSNYIFQEDDKDTSNFSVDDYLATSNNLVANIRRGKYHTKSKLYSSEGELVFEYKGEDIQIREDDEGLYALPITAQGKPNTELTERLKRYHFNPVDCTDRGENFISSINNELRTGEAFIEERRRRAMERHEERRKNDKLSMIRNALIFAFIVACVITLLFTFVI